MIIPTAGAMESFVNPTDLIISVSKLGEGIWVFAIMRGPEKNHKLLMDSGPLHGDIERILQEVRKTLETIIIFLEFLRHDPEKLASALRDFHDGPAGQPQILTSDFVKLIMENLERDRIVETSKFAG